MIQLIQLKSLVFQTAKLQPLSAKSMLDMRTYSLQFIAPTLRTKMWLLCRTSYTDWFCVKKVIYGYPGPVILTYFGFYLLPNPIRYATTQSF